MITLRLSDQNLEIIPREMVNPAVLVKNLDQQAAQHKVGQLFSLCGKAQQLAFAQACQAAQGLPVQHLALQPDQTELLKENLEVWGWRLLLNLPKLLQQSPQIGQLTMLRKWLSRNDFHRLPQWFNETFNLDLSSAINQPEKLLTSVKALESLGQLSDIEKSSASVKYLNANQKLMPLDFAARNARSLAELIDQPEFISQPQFKQSPWLSSSLAISNPQQQMTQPLSLPQNLLLSSVQAMAKTIQWLNLPQKPPQSSKQLVPVLCGNQSLEQGDGLGWVWARRGLLVHKVKMHHGKLIDLKILAPTEWNFHPKGILSQWADLAFKHQQPVKFWLELGCLMLDPCVEYKIDMVQPTSNRPQVPMNEGK